LERRENVKSVAQQVQKTYSPGLASVVKRLFNQYKYPVIIIYGNPDTGKTDAALKLVEIARKEGLLEYFASNINTYNNGEKITSLQRLDYWFKNQAGRKTFILDEAGIHDDARMPMSRMNREIKNKVFVIRKFHGHIIFVLQELRDIDKWKNSPLTGAFIKKDVLSGEYSALIDSPMFPESIRVRDFPRTDIQFDTLDIAPFTMENELDEEGVQLQGLPSRVAFLYAKYGNAAVIARDLSRETGQVWVSMQVKRLLMKYLREQLGIRIGPGRPFKIEPKEPEKPSLPNG